jgi:hypothetical protein
MNIKELTSNGPSWWLFIAVVLPGTIVVSTLIYAGRQYWTPSRRKAWRIWIEGLGQSSPKAVVGGEC